MIPHLSKQIVHSPSCPSAFTEISQFRSIGVGIIVDVYVSGTKCTEDSTNPSTLGNKIQSYIMGLDRFGWALQKPLNSTFLICDSTTPLFSPVRCNSLLNGHLQSMSDALCTESYFKEQRTPFWPSTLDRVTNIAKCFKAMKKTCEINGRNKSLCMSIRGDAQEPFAKSVKTLITENEAVKNCSALTFGYFFGADEWWL